MSAIEAVRFGTVDIWTDTLIIAQATEVGMVVGFDGAFVGTNGDRSVGVVQSEVLTPGIATIGRLGTYPVLAGAAVSAVGTELTATTTGAVIPAVAGNFVIAIARETASNGELLSADVITGYEKS